MNTPHAFRKFKDFPVTKNFRLGLGGIRFHNALIQGDQYNLFVRPTRHALQVIHNGIVVTSIPISSRSLLKTREICWSFSRKSKNWTFSYPESEKAFQASQSENEVQR